MPESYKKGQIRRHSQQDREHRGKQYGGAYLSKWETESD